MTRPVVDEAPLSEFVRKMREVFVRREAAKTTKDKRDIEREMEALMRQYLGRSAWDAMADAEHAAGVSRDTSSDRSCHTSGVQRDHNSEQVIDRKQLAAGDVD